MVLIQSHAWLALLVPSADVHTRASVFIDICLSILKMHTAVSQNATKFGLILIQGIEFSMHSYGFTINLFVDSLGSKFDSYKLIN